MNSFQAKSIPIVEILARMGYHPVRKDKGGVEWVYNSPFREEAIPSFFVNVRKNVFNDFGDLGGNGLDFIMRHENTSFRGALSFLETLYNKSSYKPHQKSFSRSTGLKTTLKDYVLDETVPLKSKILENYLQNRCISLPIARKYLQVVRFHNRTTEKKYFGLGFKNQSEGYEIRNPMLKTAVGDKDISIVEGSGDKSTLAIFEGFMDFLSYLTEKKTEQLQNDVIILNSTKLLQRATDEIALKNYKKVYSFFDNDTAGDKAREFLAENLVIEIKHCNHIYRNFKDYNDYFQDKSKKDQSMSK